MGKKKMEVKEKKKLAQLSLEWCIKNFGSPLRYGRTPELKFSVKRAPDAFGEYEPNTKIIRLYLNSVVCIEDIINTIVHEYCHFLQMPRSKDYSSYSKLNRSHGYDENPLELEACEYEKKYFRKCYNYVVKNYWVSK